MELEWSSIRNGIRSTYFFLVPNVSPCFLPQVSLLLGTIIRKVPLPRNTSSDLSDLEGHSVDFSSDSVLDLEQLKTIGNHFLEVLLKMKHNGAIDKTRAGFTALCNRLLCSNDSRYGFLFFCFLFL